ncbi:MAG: cytochrome c3 family protein, partial [Gemmatimonadota bacterium]|nr:cytochrome c3 family protein [Gemmatimonadota bacterium]
MDCLTCHPSVHATMVGAGEKTAARCLTCHDTAHAAIGKLYTGAGTDSAVLPDRMYLARVACRECHTAA